MAIMFLESQGEMEGRGKSNLVGNLRQGLAGVGEKMARLGESLRFQILAGRLTHLPAKKRGETRPGKTKPLRHIFQELPLAKIFGEIIDGLLNARMTTRAFLPGIGTIAKKQRALHGV